MRRISAVAVTAGVLAAGLTVVPNAVGASATKAPGLSPARATASSYTPPKLTWGKCANPRLAQGGSQCAMLTVPLDYAKPNGRKIQLAVSRHQHKASAGKYQGVMLVNPGGPGGSGLIYSVFGEGPYVPGNADLTYDWIGFDPRGVGSSKPALTCNSSFFGLDRPSYIPTTGKIERYWLRKSAHYATDCDTAKARRLLDHVATVDSVNDMESLRKALGQKRINFYGFSYGTYLGQVYATLHPKQVRRFVFDGTVDPQRVFYKSNLDQDRAFQKTIEAYFGYLAKHDKAFHLGNSADAIDRRYYRLRDRLDAKPIDGIGPDELDDVMLSAGYYVYDWVSIGKAYAALYNKGDASMIKEMYLGANPQKTPGSDNGFAMYLATQCTDAPWPHRYAKVRTDNWRVFADAPFETWGNAWFNGPCLTWPGQVAKGSPVDVTGRKVTSNVLMIGETLDAATPFAGSLVVRKLFPTASLIEGVGGTTHAGSLSGVACTDDTIATYLANGKVPARKAGNVSDKKCPPVPAPDPSAATAQQRKAAGGGISGVLRESLIKAQLHRS